MYTIGSDLQYTQGTGRASARVTTGLTEADILGRAMIVHDHTGARVACSLVTAVVPPPPTYDFVVDREVTTWSKYPTYTGELAVSGSINVGTDAEHLTQELAWDLTGVDAQCGTVDITGIANACGIHIHKGTDCSNHTDIAGHYWNETMVASDPWQTLVYTIGSSLRGTNGTGSARARVTTDLSKDDILGRAMVVHDHKGGRIACGIITVSERPLPSGAVQSTAWLVGLVLAVRAFLM